MLSHFGPWMDVGFLLSWDGSSGGEVIKLDFEYVPSDCKENKPIHPKGNQPCISLEGLLLKLKLQYFGHMMQRGDSLEKTLMLGKIEGKRRREWQRKR